MKKLDQLFEQARQETAPVSGEHFRDGVMATIRRDQARAPSTSWWEHLGDLLPRLAVATVILAALCFVGDAWFSNAYADSLSGDVAALSEQWLFAGSAN